MLITRKNVEDVARSALQGLSILESLHKYALNPLDFMRFLENNPDDAAILNLSSIIETESAIRNSINRLNAANDKFELDKAIAVNRAAQWLGEKLVSKTYGQKMEVSHTGSIDLIAIINEGRERRKVESKVIDKIDDVAGVESVGYSAIEDEKLLQADDLIG